MRLCRDLEKYEQIYEFTYQKADACTCIASNNCQKVFAAGFASGSFRVFDIERICIVEEGQFFESRLIVVQFSAKGLLLAAADLKGNYRVFDAAR